MAEKTQTMIDLTPMFAPKAAAVIGASNNPAKLGHSVISNLTKSGYPGKLLPVNPHETSILGHPCFSTLTEAARSLYPETIDLAVLVIPGRAVIPAAEECGRLGIQTMIVISAGFKETGKEGLEAEKKLVSLCRQHGIRMLGPNCLGLMDTHTPLNASFAAGFPKKGDIAFISQSGALCASILDWSLDQGMGFSKFVSLGNKADLSEVDFIADAAADPYSRVILSYIEDVRDGERFLTVLREAARRKPVVIIKSGLSQAGAKAASSHTGALSGSDRAYETAFKQAGVLRARSMQELFDLASAFSHLPIPKGNRVAIVTNSGGPGILASDAVEGAGLAMASFTKDTVDKLRSNLPAEAAVYNPVDIIGDAGYNRYRFALETVATDPNVDSLLVLLTPTASTRPAEVSRVIVETKRANPSLPVVGVLMGGESVKEGKRILLEAHVPSYFAPERAVTALRGVTEYGRHLRTPPVEPDLSFVDLDRQAAQRIFEGVRREGRLVLLGNEAAEVARAYGISAAPAALARSPDEAARIAADLDGPVVMKVASPKIMHKTDIGGVRIGIGSPSEVRTAYLEILEAVHRHLGPVEVHGIEIQPLMPKGRELIVGMSRDVQFGPMVAFGLGGIYVNLLKDVSFRLASGLSMAEIRAMLAETKAYLLLRGLRGEAPADIDSVVNTVARTARLALDFPEIVEMDINPLVAYQDGVLALDVKITISQTEVEHQDEGPIHNRSERERQDRLRGGAVPTASR